jgi:hypothetical protein
LKVLGFEVRLIETFPNIPTMLIEEIPPEPGDDDAAAQLENEKSKKFFDPKRAKSKALSENSNSRK